MCTFCEQFHLTKGNEERFEELGEMTGCNSSSVLLTNRKGKVKNQKGKGVLEMKARLFLFSMFLLIPVLALAGCNSQSSGGSEKAKDKETHAHEDMNHSGSSEVPKGLKKAENPTYKVGSDVMILASHMKGMKNAQGTVTGAYDTTVYSVSYTPTTGGKRVKDHKWVIQEELKGAGDKTLKPGDKAVIEASHMKGMKGAEAVIDSAKKTTVYMVDYTSTDGGQKVTNHKWVTEDELSAAK